MFIVAIENEGELRRSGICFACDAAPPELRPLLYLLL